MKALILLMLLAVPVRAYTLEKDPSSPTGYSYGTGPSTGRIEGYQLGPGYRQDNIYVNGSPRGTCRTFSSGGYSQTSCQ
jgi:hypothetical protein